jgi:hypothetical protein
LISLEEIAHALNETASALIRVASRPVRPPTHLAEPKE